MIKLIVLSMVLISCGDSSEYNGDDKPEIVEESMSITFPVPVPIPPVDLPPVVIPPIIGDHNDNDDDDDSRRCGYRRFVSHVRHAYHHCEWGKATRYGYLQIKCTQYRDGKVYRKDKFTLRNND